MVELIVVCEGSTEREFCRQVVAPHLAAFGVAVSGTLVGKPHRKRGGISKWPRYRSELIRLGKERSERHLAVLVDYYGMPTTWPGRESSKAAVVTNRGIEVENALIEDLAADIPGRFHPCVQLHEFESLLFVDPDLSALSIAIGSGLSDDAFVSLQLKAVRAECGGSVELINDDPETAPSKRLEKIVRGYDKVAWGVAAVKDVTIERLQRECAWLRRWIDRMKMLGQS